LRNVVSLYFGSKVTVEWLDRVVGIVSTHEEPHPVGVPQNLAPNKLATITAEAHRSVNPLWHLEIVLPLCEEVQVQPGLEEAIANLQNKIRTIRGQK
jgi:hypothetical protein